MAKDGQTHLDYARARNRHPATSHHAADSVQPHLSEIQERVLSILRHYGPSSADRVERLYLDRYDSGCNRSSPRGRLNELETGGKVRRPGRKVKNPRGRDVQVWEAVE